MGCGSSSQSECLEPSPTQAQNGVSKQVGTSGETKKEKQRNGSVSSTPKKDGGSSSTPKKSVGTLNNNTTRRQSCRPEEEQTVEELNISVSRVLCLTVPLFPLQEAPRG